MSYSVTLPPDSQGYVTLSLSFFDLDQDNIIISSVAVQQKNSVDYAIPQTFAFITYTTSGTYLVPGGYRGSMSKLDLFIYIDTDHPDIETGSQYLLRVDYTDNVNLTKSVSLNFYNGNLEFENVPYLYYGIFPYLSTLSGVRIVSQLFHSSSIPGALTFSSIGGSSTIRFYSSYFNVSISGFNPYYFHPVSPFYDSPLIGGNDIHLYYIFAPYATSLTYYPPWTFSLYFTNDDGRNLFALRIITSSEGYIVFDAISNYFNVSPVRITLSNFNLNTGLTLIEWRYEHSGTLSLFINGVLVFTQSNVTYNYLGTVRVGVASLFMYGDIFIYRGSIYEEEKRVIRNKFTHKYYPKLKTPPLFTISVGATQIYP